MEDLIDFVNSPRSTKKSEKLLVQSMILEQNCTQSGLSQLNDSVLNKNLFGTAEKDYSSGDSFEFLSSKIPKHEFCVKTENLLYFDEDFKPSNTAIDSVLSVEENYEGEDNKEIKNINTTNTSCRQNVTEEFLIDFGDGHRPKEFLENSESSTNSTPNSDNSVKYNKTDFKNRLLKLSLSNALVQSPLSRRASLEDGASPESLIFKEAAKLAKQLAQMNLNSPSSSPRRSADDSCDDLMEISPNWVDSDSDISKELEFFKIPMLDKITENNVEKDKFEKNMKSNISDINQPNDNVETLFPNDIAKTSIDVDALKAKIKSKQTSGCSKSSEDIDSLISNLKDYVIHHNSDYTKIDEAQKLLESLSFILKDNKIQNKEETDKLLKNNDRTTEEATEHNGKNKIEVIKPPNSIVRQGTFDIDLVDNNKSEPKTDEDVITFDEKEMASENELDSSSQIHPEVNEIVEQLGRILGGTQNINVLQANLNSSTSTCSNPTYIVVMGTPNKNILSNSNIQYEEILELSPDLKQNRRRSYSLSLPDKKNIKLQNSKSHAKQILSPTKDCNTFKTPIRSTYRRNSISSSAPHKNTPSINLSTRRTIYENTNLSIKSTNTPKRPSVITSTQNRLSISTNEISKNQQSKCMMHLGTDINSKRFRLKSSETVTVKGPIKATAQMKSIVPKIQCVPSTPTQNPDNKRKSMLDPNLFSWKSKNVTVKNPPIACSTPLLATPKKMTNINKTNQSNRLSITPNGKPYSNLLGATSNLITNRRKSFSDTSTKNVVKTALNSNVTQNPTISREIPKIINKFKLASNLIQPTLPNKENKEPKK